VKDALRSDWQGNSRPSDTAATAAADHDGATGALADAALLLPPGAPAAARLMRAAVLDRPMPPPGLASGRASSAVSAAPSALPSVGEKVLSATGCMTLGGAAAAAARRDSAGVVGWLRSQIGTCLSPEPRRLLLGLGLPLLLVVPRGPCMPAGVLLPAVPPTSLLMP
jgi:hypothetical protein